MKKQHYRRSDCPISFALETFGDMWSLLIARDIIYFGKKTYGEFLESDEGIATNILADRLKKLETCGIITTEREPLDRRKLIYRLTAKGIDLAPVLMELVVWAARYEDTGAPPAFIRKMQKNREQFLAEVRQRWVEKAAGSILPGDRTL